MQTREARLRHRVSLLVIWLLVAAWLPAGAESEQERPDGAPRAEVELWFFWSLACPHCLEARPEVHKLAAQHAWIRLRDLELSRHPEHIERYVAMAAALGQEARAVPGFIYCGRLEVGWDTAETTGRTLLAGLESCRRSGTAPPEAMTAVHLPLLGELDARTLSLPVLTVLIAGMDAFNPCAFFVLLFLLSLLVHQRDRKRMLIVGVTFGLISGLMYFSFMAAWLGLFRVMGNLPWVTALAGATAVVIGALNIKDFAAFKQGPSLSIPESRKPDVYQRGRRVLAAGNLPAMLAATVVLAVAANFYELLCTAGFPMVYTRLLTLQAASPRQHYLYLALYNLVYVLPMLAIVAAFVRTMGARKLTEREGRLLKLLSGLMMFGLGLLLLVAPASLNNLWIAFGLVVLAAGSTWLAARLRAA